MTSLDVVESLFERLRPALNADGGDIELIALEGNVARVRLTGACAECPAAHMTLHVGVESALRRLHPDLRVQREA